MTEAGRTLVVYADGGSRGNPGPAGFGALVLDDATGTVLAERAGFLGETTNNVAEYTGLVAGLTAAAGIDPRARVHVRMDSRLVVEQMSGRWQIKHEELRRLAAAARGVFSSELVDFTWIPRAENSAADRLANEAMDSRKPVISRDFPADPGDGSAQADEILAAASEELVLQLASGEPTPRPPGAPMLRLFREDEPTTFVLVRHGETALTEVGGYSGSATAGPPLTSHGRIQAAQAADLVARIGREIWGDLPRPSVIISSPMTRTAETAAAIGRRLGRSVSVDPRFAEVNFGEWESLTFGQIDEKWPGLVARWNLERTTRPPGGESYADVGARVSAGLADVAKQYPGRTVVIASHTIAIRAAVGSVLFVPIALWSRWRIPPASVSVLRMWAEEPAEVTAVGIPSDL